MAGLQTVNARLNTLREGQLYSIVWNEPANLSSNPGQVKVLAIIPASPEHSALPIYASICAGTQGVILFICLDDEKHETHSGPKNAESSWIINVAKDGIVWQMSQDKYWKRTWTTSLHGYQIGSAASFQILIDFGLPLVEILPKKKNVSQQVMEKMLADRTLADVTFKFPGNIVNYIC